MNKLYSSFYLIILLIFLSANTVYSQLNISEKKEYLEIRIEFHNSEKIFSSNAPEPVGLYPHARRVGSLLFLSGVGPRKKNERIYSRK